MNDMLMSMERSNVAAAVRAASERATAAEKAWECAATAVSEARVTGDAAAMEDAAAEAQRAKSFLDSAHRDVIEMTKRMSSQTAAAASSIRTEAAVSHQRVAVAASEALLAQEMVQHVAR